MRKKKNIIKRNSGFIVGCVIAAGASFFTANMLMSDMVTLVTPETGTTEAPSEAVLEPEKTVTRTYETDAFTVTASGNVIKGVEEIPETETKQTDENGEVIGSGETDADGVSVETSTGGNSAENTESTDDGYQDGDYWEQNGSDNSSSGNDSYDVDIWVDNGSYSDGNYSDNSYSDGGYSDGPIIEIQNPGNGDYTYSDNSGSNSNSSGNSSSSGTTAWTPDDVILWGISSRYIDVSELYSYGPATLRLIRNEIFALHGRIFKSQDLMDYFSQKSWYVPTYNPEDFDANMFYYLNDYEEANLQTILDYEAWYAENY